MDSGILGEPFRKKIWLWLGKSFTAIYFFSLIFLIYETGGISMFQSRWQDKEKQCIESMTHSRCTLNSS